MPRNKNNYPVYRLEWGDYTGKVYSYHTKHKKSFLIRGSRLSFDTVGFWMHFSIEYMPPEKGEEIFNGSILYTGGALSRALEDMRTFSSKSEIQFIKEYNERKSSQNVTKVSTGSKNKKELLKVRLGRQDRTNGTITKGDL